MPARGFGALGTGMRPPPERSSRRIVTPRLRRRSRSLRRRFARLPRARNRSEIATGHRAPQHQHDHRGANANRYQACAKRSIRQQHTHCRAEQWPKK